MAARTAQIVARGTAFRRAATWTMNSIMAAGASGVEIGVAGKLRSDRSHSEKYRMGVVPKSGEASKEVVRQATTDVLLKLGLYGIQVSIALKGSVPPMVEYIEQPAEAPPGPGRRRPAPTPAPSAPTAQEPTVGEGRAAPGRGEARHSGQDRDGDSRRSKPKEETERRGEAGRGTTTPGRRSRQRQRRRGLRRRPKRSRSVPEVEAELNETVEPAVLETVEQVAKSESKES